MNYGGIIMRKILQSLATLLLVSLILSCSGNPFMSNIFSKLDPYNLPESFESADDVLGEAGKDGFLDALAEDEQKAVQVITVLEGSLPADPANADAEDQQAALLLADVHLATTGGTETMGNINNLASDFVSGDTSSLDGVSGMGDVLGLFFDVSEPTESVEKQLTAFVEAAAAYEFYGDTIGEIGASSELDGGEKSVLAVTAAVAGVTEYLVSNIAGENPTDAQRADAISQIASSIANGTELTLNDDPVLNDSTVDPMAHILGAGVNAVVMDGVPNLEALISGATGSGA